MARYDYATLHKPIKLKNIKELEKTNFYAIPKNFWKIYQFHNQKKCKNCGLLFDKKHWGIHLQWNVQNFVEEIFKFKVNLLGEEINVNSKNVENRKFLVRKSRIRAK